MALYNILRKRIIVLSVTLKPQPPSCPSLRPPRKHEPPSPTTYGGATNYLQTHFLLLTQPCQKPTKLRFSPLIPQTPRLFHYPTPLNAQSLPAIDIRRSRQNHQTQDQGFSIYQLKRVVGDSSPGLFSLLNKSPWFMRSSLEKTMIPNIEFLKTTCGIDDSVVAKFMYLAPRLFLLQHEFLKGCVERIDQMGFHSDSKMFLYGVWSIGSMSLENWERTLELFRSLGCSEDDIGSAFRRAPRVFSLSDRNIKEATEALLLSARNHDISLIVNYPELLIYSVEKRLKPRIRVLEVLESKNLVVKKPSMKRFCSMPNDEFLKKYVLRYSAEAGTVYPHKGSTET